MSEVDEITSEDLAAAAALYTAWVKCETYSQRAHTAALAYADQIVLSKSDLDSVYGAYACSVATIEAHVSGYCKALLALQKVRLSELNEEAMAWLVARAMGVPVTLVRENGATTVKSAGQGFWTPRQADLAMSRWGITLRTYAPHGFMHDRETMWGARTARNTGGLLGDAGYGRTREQAILRCAVSAAHPLGQTEFDVPSALARNTTPMKI
ncbi:MAG: hypothetical protein IT475_05510 [Aquimonas sp.]|nr:hypothetical protein [Aquimonas sp.]